MCRLPASATASANPEQLWGPPALEFGRTKGFKVDVCTDFIAYGTLYISVMLAVAVS
jgi:hypothetical protein